MTEANPRETCNGSKNREVESGPPDHSNPLRKQTAGCSNLFSAYSRLVLKTFFHALTHDAILKLKY